MALNLSSTPDTTNAAFAMYQRLRQNGQTSPLARISVEARYSTLTTVQRQQLRQMIARAEASL
jgi:hypothetical protein